MFDEMAAALQFPSYFGENWPAFDECLSDMYWLQADLGIVILLLEPDRVLDQAPAVELRLSRGPSLMRPRLMASLSTRRMVGPFRNPVSRRVVGIGTARAGSRSMGGGPVPALTSWSCD
jgi:hypothetical protein